MPLSTNTSHFIYYTLLLFLPSTTTCTLFEVSALLGCKNWSSYTRSDGGTATAAGAAGGVARMMPGLVKRIRDYGMPRRRYHIFLGQNTILILENLVAVSKSRGFMLLFLWLRPWIRSLRISVTASLP
jgi:hypothetical protein